MDYVIPPYEEHSGNDFAQVMENTTPGTELRLKVSGHNDVNNPVTLTMMVEMSEGDTGLERLDNYGQILSLVCIKRVFLPLSNELE